MPGFLLHVGAVVQCAHLSPAQPTIRNPRVKVSGQNIVTRPCVYQISSCPQKPPVGPPCLLAQWLTTSLRIKANGLPVLLSDSQSLCNPSGTPLTIVTTQIRVKGQ